MSELLKIGGTLFWGPHNQDPTILGTRLGSPIFGNSLVVEPLNLNPNQAVQHMQRSPRLKAASDSKHSKRHHHHHHHSHHHYRRHEPINNGDNSLKYYVLPAETAD